MSYSTTIYDLFEIHGPLTGSTIAEHEGVNGTYPTTFSSVIEPITIQTAYATVLFPNDTLTLDGATWTVSGLAEASGFVASGDPLNGGVLVNTSLLVLTITDGTATRTLAAEFDAFNYPLNDADGNPLGVTHLQISSLSPLTYVSTAYVGTDDPNRMGAFCFAAGTMIDTATGPRPVQRLEPGDLVMTRDHGLQPLRWLGGRRLSAGDLDRAPHLVPIRIRAGALGPGQPAQDLTVSPQHRILIRSRVAERISGQPEVLVAAVHLLDLPGVDRVPGHGGVAYWHLMFDRHEIVFANGAEAESLYLGPMARKTLSPEALAEIDALFPDLADGVAQMELVRTTLRGAQTRRLVERQVRNRKPLVAPLPLA